MDRAAIQYKVLLKKNPELITQREIEYQATMERLNRQEFGNVIANKNVIKLTPISYQPKVIDYILAEGIDRKIQDFNDYMMTDFEKNRNECNDHRINTNMSNLDLEVKDIVKDYQNNVAFAYNNAAYQNQITQSDIQKPLSAAKKKDAVNKMIRTNIFSGKVSKKKPFQDKHRYEIRNTLNPDSRNTSGRKYRDQVIETKISYIENNEICDNKTKR